MASSTWLWSSISIIMDDSPETQRSTLDPSTNKVVTGAPNYPQDEDIGNGLAILIKGCQSRKQKAVCIWTVLGSTLQPRKHVVTSFYHFFVTQWEHTNKSLKLTNSSRFSFVNTAGSKAMPHLPWRPSWGGDCLCPEEFCKRALRCCQFGPGCLWGWYRREDCSTGQYIQHLKMNKNYQINSYATLFLLGWHFTLDILGHGSLHHPTG